MRKPIPTKRGRASQSQTKRLGAAQELAAWMRLLLEARCMSVSELARRTGRDRADVSRSLTGKHDWEFSRIKDYAEALLLEPRDIVTTGKNMLDAFNTVYRPIIEWAMVRSCDRGLCLPVGL